MRSIVFLTFIQITHSEWTCQSAIDVIQGQQSASFPYTITALWDYFPTLKIQQKTQKNAEKKLKLVIVDQSKLPMVHFI